jgi:stearoyl-CoA desaturase (delta-9 desaturase)
VSAPTASLRLQLPPTINSRPLQQAQYRMALVTIVVPTVGAVVAFALIPVLPPRWFDLGMWAVLHLVGMLGITVGFHRLFAHRSFKAGNPVRFVLGVMGSLAAEGPLIHWVSNHRRHHENSDGPDDVHTPHGHGKGVWGWLQGFWHAHVGWMFTSGVTHPGRYSPDLLRDPLAGKLNRAYTKIVVLGLVVPAAAGGLFDLTWEGAVLGLLWGGFVRVFSVHHMTWAINSVTHLLGRRPYDTPEHSTNNAWLAVPTAGEAWHNSHHAFPTSARFGLEWWQLDLGWMLIRTLQAVGLAWEVTLPSPAMRLQRSQKDVPQTATPRGLEEVSTT